MKRSLFLLWVLWTGPVFAVEPRVVIHANPVVSSDSIVTIRLTGTVSETPVVLEAAEKPDGPTGESVDFVVFGPAKKPSFALTLPPKVGTYRFAAIATGTVKDDDGNDIKKNAYGFVTVTVTGKVPPQPVPVPVPPNPIPPQPPQPVPVPDPVPVPPNPIPIPNEGDLRVLMLWESSQGLSRKQESVWYSSWLTKALNEMTVKDTKGRAGYRKWDIDTSIVSEGPEWQMMMDAAKAELAKPTAPKLPVIVVFRGTHGKAAHFPDSQAALLQLLKQ